MGRPQSAPYFYSMANQNGSKDRYVLSIMDKSKRAGYKKIVFHASKREAGLKAKELYDDYVKKNTPVPGEINRPITVQDACTIFISRREAGRKEVCQAHSIEQVSARFRNHLLPFLGQVKLDELSVEYVVAYKQKLDKKGLAGKTVQYCLDEAKEFFGYCVEGNIEDYRKMLLKGWGNPINHAVTMVCFFTGMRVSEIRALKKKDFETFYGHEVCEDCVILHIRHSLTNRNIEKTPKNGRERLTVIPRWVYEFISPVMMLSKSDLCFSNTYGKKPISIDKNLYQFRNALASVTGMTAEEVKASGIDFHSLRKMFNSMMTGTLSSDIRRGILGWTSENVALEHYFQVLPIHYQKILDAQKVLFDEESVEWFRNHDILDLSDEYKISRKRRNSV